MRGHWWVLVLGIVLINGCGKAESTKSEATKLKVEEPSSTMPKGEPHTLIGGSKARYEGVITKGTKESGIGSFVVKEMSPDGSDHRGDSYEGEFKGANRHGKGTYIWSNGTKYVGEWKDNEMHGQLEWLGLQVSDKERTA